MNDIATSHRGSVGQLEDGRFFVLFERQTPHSIDHVWQAITDPEQLQVWFPEISLDAELGGQFKIWFGGECDGPAHVEGAVSEFDPPNTLQLGGMRFELEENDQVCLIRFSDILNMAQDMAPIQITDSVLSGWHRFMDALQAHLSGEPFDRDVPEPSYRDVDVPGKELVTH